MRIKHRGFTLLEILIAMFVFSILALILSSALHNVINIQAGTDKSAERLRTTQFALLLISRDVEQAVNRPILNATGHQDAAFIGKTKSMTFTNAGVATSTDAVARSNMQRTEYIFHEHAIWRKVWPYLDQATEAKPHRRKLLADIADMHFEYIDEKNREHREWPIPGQSATQALPHAVRIYLTIPGWGSMSQLYVIPVQSAQKIAPQPGA